MTRAASNPQQDPWRGEEPPARTVLVRQHPQVPDFTYYLRLSRKPDPQRVLVAVHGISRNPEFMLRCLAEQADHCNFSILAPLFNHRTFADFQRLGRRGRGARADLALLAMLEDAASCLPIPEHFSLFGFSGGAQFAHRFTYAYPDLVKNLVLSSAGWYTAMDNQQGFPYGTRPTRRLPGLEFSTAGLAATPTLTTVGDLDTLRDDALRCNDKLDSVQGHNRLERACWFQRTLARRASEQGLTPRHQLKILPNTSHDLGEAVLRGGLVNSIFEFCCNELQRDNQEHPNEY